MLSLDVFINFTQTRDGFYLLTSQFARMLMIRSLIIFGLFFHKETCGRFYLSSFHHARSSRKATIIFAITLLSSGKQKLKPFLLRVCARINYKAKRIFCQEFRFLEFHFVISESVVRTFYFLRSIPFFRSPVLKLFVPK